MSSVEIDDKTDTETVSASQLGGRISAAAAICRCGRYDAKNSAASCADLLRPRAVTKLASAVPYLHEAERRCKLTGNLSDLAMVCELSAGVYGTADAGKAALEYANLHFQAATRLGDAQQLVQALDGLGCV